MTMSCDGDMIGAPLAGLKMLCVESISTCASACASIDSGRWTAIWSPSKSALKPLQTSGCRLDRVAFHQHRLEGLDAHAVQRRGAVEQHRVLVDHLFEDVPHLGSRRSSIFLALLIVSARPCSLSLRMMNGW
jgi:hypothetical protein